MLRYMLKCKGFTDKHALLTPQYGLETGRYLFLSLSFKEVFSCSFSLPCSSKCCQSTCCSPACDAYRAEEQVYNYDHALFAMKSGLRVWRSRNVAPTVACRYYGMHPRCAFCRSWSDGV